ncbi:hypothetical protein V2O64_17110 [Verrucomicrobiaceae bacterium 227]
MTLRLLLSSLALVTASAHADQIIAPSQVTTNGVPELYPAINLINSSGLSAPVNDLNYETITHHDASSGGAWATNNPNGSGDFFTSESEGPLPILTFTLPGTSTVNGLVYWGYHFGVANGNEARAFFLEFSRDGGNTFPDSTTLSSDLSTFAAATSKTLPFGQDFTANTIRVSLTDNHFGHSLSR